MRQRTNETRGRARKPIAVVSAFLMVATVMVALAQPSGAATTIRRVPITCVGADKPSQDLLDIMGGSIKADVDIEVTLPDKLTPGETGAMASFLWTTKLSASLANTAAGFGVNQVNMSNMQMDVRVEGPTSLTTIPGRPAARNIAVQANTPISSTAGPFTAEITDVGNTGFIAFKSTRVLMTVSLSIGGANTALNITCAAPATLGTVSIQVKGSPEVQNFTEIVSGPGTKNFDVLGSAIPGTNDAGEEQPIVPESLKILSGNGTINEDGTIDVPAPAPGQTNEVVYELCAPDVETMPAFEGVDEEQIITFDGSGSAGFKRTVAFQLGLGDKTTAPIWSARNNLTGNFETGHINPNNWENIALNYYPIHRFAYPRASAIRTALEGIVGAGNVEVEGPTGSGSQRQYKVTFVNDLGKQDVPEIEVTNHYSIPPQEILTAILGLATSLVPSGEGDPGTTTTTIPGGLTLQQYYNQLNAQAQQALTNFDFNLYLELTGKALQLIADNPTAFIDVNAAIAAISSLFPPGPAITTDVPGEEEREAEFQRLCSQGVISVSTTQTQTEDPPGTPTTVPGTPAPPAGDPAPSGTGGTGTGTGTGTVTGTAPTAAAPTAAATTGAPIGITG